MVARVSFVGDALTHGATHNVNLTELTCSYGFSLQAGGQCRHVYVVIDRLRLPNGKLRFTLSENHFHQTSRTSFWKRLYRESPATTGIFPTEDEVRQLARLKLAQQVPVVVVKPWCEIDETESLSLQRYESRGDGVGGGGITKKRKAKSDRRPCARCTKLVSGYTRHCPTACLRFYFKKQLLASKESQLCFTFDSVLYGLRRANEGNIEHHNT